MIFTLTEQISSLEKQEWNVFVAESTHSHFFQQSCWADVQQARPGQTVLYLQGREQGNLRVSAILLQKSIPGLGLSQYEIHCGPVLDDPNEFSEILIFLEKKLRPRAISLEMNPRWMLEEALPIVAHFEALGFKRNPDPSRYHSDTVVLDLRLSQEEILHSFRQTTRHEIAKAQKAHAQIRISHCLEDIGEFYRLYEPHVLARGAKPEPRRFFDQIGNLVLSHPESGFLALAEWNGQALSAGIFFRNGRRVWYTYGASSIVLKRELSTSHLLHWEAIRYAQSVGCHFYDFGGALENIGRDHPSYGVVLFKLGFTKHFSRYLSPYEKVYRPAWKAGIEWRRRMRLAVSR